MNAIVEVLGVAAVFAVSGAVTYIVTSALWRRENRRRRHEASRKWRGRVKRELDFEKRWMKFFILEDYRAEVRREKQCANTVVKGSLADEFYALDETARKAVLTRRPITRELN